MKKCLTMVLVYGLLLLLVGGCSGERENAPSPASESTVDVGLAANADAGTTVTTDWGSVTVSRTHPTAPFTVGAAVRVRDEVYAEDFSGQVIISKAQLDALALNQEYGTERYTEQYFEDKALVVLEFRLTSGSIQLQVDTVGVNGNTMTVFYTTVRPNPFTNDMAYHRILLEISQKTADGIEHIVGERVPILLPSSSTPNPTAL